MIMELEGTKLENCVQRDLKKGYMNTISKLVQNMRIFGSHVNVYQRATMTEETFNNQRDKMVLCMDVNQPLSPATAFLDQCV